MYKVDLKPHNEQTMEKIIEFFKTSNKCCAIQATGTGKTFLILRLLEMFQNEDKNAVIFAPNREIIKQTKNKMKKYGINNAVFYTYQKLSRMSDNEIVNINVDLIVCDELHRTGAKTWGIKFESLVDSHQNAKVFGVTATPLRCADGRDMAEEYFDNNKACDISLAEALVRKIIPVIAICIIGIMLTVIVKKSGHPLTVDTILEYTPDNTLLAIVVMLTFFALKSLTVVLPLSVLYFACGMMFSPFSALLVSTAGLAVTITIPYLIGKYAGKQTVKCICEKYPKAAQVAVYQQKNNFFACFITRIVGFLPGDIVSLYFGACDAPYAEYLAAGIAGSMLSIVTTTLLGEKINNPFSVEFLIILLCRVAVSAVAVVINHVINYKKIKNV